MIQETATAHRNYHEPRLPSDGKFLHPRKISPTLKRTDNLTQLDKHYHYLTPITLTFSQNSRTFHHLFDIIPDPNLLLPIHQILNHHSPRSLSSFSDLQGKMSSETEFSSIIERLINSRNRDLSLFLPFILALTDLPETINNSDQDSSSNPEQETSHNRTQTTWEPRDRIILINPLTQGLVVIEGSGSDDGSFSSLDSLMRELLNKTGHPPASKASIEALPVVEIDKEGEECVICLEEWEVGGMAKEMPCKHKYHGGCIEKWLKIHGSCPVCRHKMPVEENNVDKNKINGGGENSSRRRRELWVSFSFASPSSVVDQDTES